jgi:hypothetical protein
MKVKVFGGLYHGRYVILPEGVQRGDYAELPLNLPEGERHARGRTNPELHQDARMYQVEFTQGNYYLGNVSLRFIRSIQIPPAESCTITVNLR